MSELLDFAIVGGGASGIYSAWRLTEASQAEVKRIREKIGGDGPLKIAVYERSSRIGGRLLSASPPSMPNEAMELGGMRYLNDQPLVTGLVEKKLRVPTYPQAVDEPTNFAYLRRQLFRQDELDKPGVELPYELTPAEKLVLTGAKTASPSQLIFWAVYREFPQLKTMPPEKVDEFLQKAVVPYRVGDGKIEKKALFKVGFWNLLSRHLSHEGRQLGITAIGYDVLGANANAVDIISENFQFQPTSKYFLFTDGYESVLWELEAQFRENGGDVRKAEDPHGARETTLESFDSVKLADGSSGYQLTFEDGSTVEARAVVLAMPRWAILNLRKKGPLLDPDRSPAKVQRMLNAVEGIPLYKLFMIYESPWWKEKWGLEQGRSLTDIPVRQCYYWSTNDGAPSAIMAYNDQASVSFWGGYQTGPQGPLNTEDEEVEGPMGYRALRKLVPPKVEAPQDEGDEEDVQSMEKIRDEIGRRRRHNWDAHDAPDEMVMEMHRQLLEMHGLDAADPSIEPPKDAAFMDWMNPPYGGAVHFWNPGYKSWQIKEDMTKPVKGEHIYVVGEAWSTKQTWVEGALQTSEIFLQHQLGMDAPDWVDGDGGL